MGRGGGGRDAEHVGRRTSSCIFADNISSYRAVNCQRICVIFNCNNTAKKCCKHNIMISARVLFREWLREARANPSVRF